MRFTSDNQRRAAFARMRAGNVALGASVGSAIGAGVGLAHKVQIRKELKHAVHRVRGNMKYGRFVGKLGGAKYKNFTNKVVGVTSDMAKIRNLNSATRRLPRRLAAFGAIAGGSLGLIWKVRNNNA